MKRLWLLTLAVPLVFFSAVGAEATLCPSGGSTTFQDYLGAGFACTIGDKTFSGFTYGSVDVLANAVSVTTLNDGTNFGFRFVMALATIGGSADIGLGYNVAVTDGSPRITDVTVFQVSGVSPGGTAIATVAETVCIGGTFPGCVGGTVETLLTTNFDPNDRIEFDPVSVVGLLKDFNVLALPCENDTFQQCSISFATLTLVDNTVSQTVPEPATLLLLGSGLVGVATWSRKKFRK